MIAFDGFCRFMLISTFIIYIFNFRGSLSVKCGCFLLDRKSRLDETNLGTFNIHFSHIKLASEELHLWENEQLEWIEYFEGLIRRKPNEQLPKHTVFVDVEGKKFDQSKLENGQYSIYYVGDVI